MDETDERYEPCPRLCNYCGNFNVLDDRSDDPYKWFGICTAALRETCPGDVTDVDTMLDWVYCHGRHGQDDCERPDEWFEE